MDRRHTLLRIALFAVAAHLALVHYSKLPANPALDAFLLVLIGSQLSD